MEHALVQRYCAVEGITCSRQIPYLGDWSFFFAYPSGPYWSDFSKALVEELAARGIQGIRWEDSVQGEVLFFKVCEGIHAHDMLFAEVTEANPNVLLEVGYAMAVGRQPVLLVDLNRREWDRRLLTTLELCRYETRENIHAYLAKLVGEPRRVPPGPNRRLPMLERTGVFERPEQPGSVYHLKPKITTDAVRRVDGVLRKSVLRSASTDATDVTYDEFFAQARKIQESELIVASLVSESHSLAREVNANVCLLIGLAIGLGKQVLVLQQKPAAPILDLGTVLRPFDTETEVKQITELWCDQHARLMIARKQEQQQRTAKNERASRIRGLYLGHPDALQDYHLLDYFIPTKEFDDALDGRRTILVGRRGSGKSADFQAVVSQLKDKPNVVLVAIAPEDFEIEKLSGFLEDEYAAVNGRLVYQTVWNYVLLSEMLRVLAEATPRLYLLLDDLERNQLLDAYNRHQAVLSLDFGSRLVAKLREIATIPINLQAEEKRIQLEASVKDLRDYQVGRLLRDFAKREKITFFLIADDLDKHWRPDTKQSVELLLGLVAEADRLQRFFEGHLKVVLFLREDIHEVLRQYDDDLPKRNLLKMQWTSQNLKHLVAERIARIAEVDSDDDDEVWEAVFASRVKGQATPDYIIGRSLPRPRDVLDFCQKGVDHAQRNGHDLVTEADILDAERDFSEDLLRSVSLEFRTLYPKLDEVLLEFAGARTIMNWPEFESFAARAIQRKRDVVKGWYGASNPDPEYLAGIFFRAGVIGFSSRSVELTLFANGRSYDESRSLVGPVPLVVMHPAFERALELTQLSQAQGDRPAQRRRKPDPSQIPLDLPDN